MSNPIAWIVDTSFDLPRSYVDDEHIYIAPLSIHFPENSYLDPYEIDRAEFYRRIKTETPTTSASVTHYFADFFDDIRSRGIRDVMMLSLSSKLSAMYTMMKVAAEDAPDLKIRLIDTQAVTAAAGMILRSGVRYAKAGHSLEQVEAYLRRHIGQARIYGFVHDISYLIRGGRVPAVKGAIANILQLRPLLCLSPEGTLEQTGKARGDMAAIKSLRKIWERHRPSGAYDFAIGHASNTASLDALNAQFQDALEGAKNALQTDLTPVLGAHTGDGLYYIAWLPHLDA